MALTVIDGILTLNDKPWVDYRVLNKELTRVYEILLVDDEIIASEINKPEKNVMLIDENTGLSYFIAIKNEYEDNEDYSPLIYLDKDDCIDMCNTVSNIKEVVDTIQMNVSEILLDIETETTEDYTSNGWKLI